MREKGKEIHPWLSDSGKDLTKLAGGGRKNQRRKRGTNRASEESRMSHEKKKRCTKICAGQRRGQAIKQVARPTRKRAQPIRCQVRVPFPSFSVTRPRSSKTTRGCKVETREQHAEQRGKVKRKSGRVERAETRGGGKKISGGVFYWFLELKGGWGPAGKLVKVNTNQFLCRKQKSPRSAKDQKIWLRSKGVHGKEEGEKTESAGKHAA